MPTQAEVDAARKAGKRSGQASANAKKGKRKGGKRKVALGIGTSIAFASAVAEASRGTMLKNPLTGEVRLAVKRVMNKFSIPTDNNILNALAIMIATMGLKRVLNEMRMNPELFRIGGRLVKAV